MELIAEYDELQLFMMAFPVKFLIDVLLPMANQSMMNEMDLSEFFVWLGCIFSWHVILEFRIVGSGGRRRR